MSKINNKLAIKEGSKIIKTKLSEYKTIGLNEKNAVTNVLKSGILSKFLASSNADYKGNNFLVDQESLLLKIK